MLSLDLRVETDLSRKLHRLTRMNRQKKPTLIVGEMRQSGWASWRVPNIQANLLELSFGFLQHNDVKAMRNAQVTILNPHRNPKFRTGQKVTLRANGVDYRIDT